MEFDECILRGEEAVVFRLRSLYRRYGYTRYKMSRFEEYELYVQNKDFLVSDQVITFTDRTGRLMAMKPDVTLSIIRNRSNEAEGVSKVYYNENVYRVAKGAESFSEIMQAGLECIGAVGLYEKWEVLRLACESLMAIAPRYVLDVSHMGALTALLESGGVTGQAAEEIIGCIGQKNVHDIRRICERYGIGEAVCGRIQRLVECYGRDASVLAPLRELCDAPEYRCALQELETVCGMLWEKGYSVNLDFSIVNDMNYYSGLVFRGYVEDIPAGVLSGGQYDKLMRKMRKKGGAIGFAVYLDELERRAAPKAVYDVDTVLLYEPETGVAGVAAAVEELTAAGQSVLALPRDDGTIRRRKTLKIGRKGLESVESHG